VCGAVAVWRGQKEAIVEGLRLSSTPGAAGTETGAPTPEGRVGQARRAVERAIGAAETLVEGIERAGTPDTAEGEAAADQLESWANGAVNDLEQAAEQLDETPENPEEAVEQLAEATRLLGTVIASGAQQIVDLAVTDPELASAIQESSTCQELREEVEE
jgi:hypothetical protein